LGNNDLFFLPLYLNESLKLYPNPFTNELIIETKSNTDNMHIELINSLGQVVFKGSLVEKTIIPTASFSPGIYILKVEDGKTFEFSKLIKE